MTRLGRTGRWTSYSGKTGGYCGHFKCSLRVVDVVLVIRLGPGVAGVCLFGRCINSFDFDLGSWLTAKLLYLFPPSSQLVSSQVLNHGSWSRYVFFGGISDFAYLLVG
jgi:hypothetical protein